MDTPTVGHNRGAPRQGLRVAGLGERLRAIGFTPFFTDATGSTNTDLVEAVRAERTGHVQTGVTGENSNFYNKSGEVPHLTVLLAEEQLAGRGRMGRPWTAPKHSQVIASVVLRLRGVPADCVGLLPLLTGLAIAQGVRTASAFVGKELPAQLKWPNDVLLNGRKLAGILVEAANIDNGAAGAASGRAGTLLKEAVIVLGFGVNYDLTTEELPVSHATSIALEAERAAGRVPGQATDNQEAEALPIPQREDVIFHVLDNLARDVQRFTQLGGAPESIMGRYRQLSSTVGTQVKAFLPGEEFVVGKAIEVNNSGELVLEVQAYEGKQLVAPGQLLTVSVGDVEHLRSADTGRTSEWGYA